MDRWIEGLPYVEDKQRQGSYNRATKGKRNWPNNGIKQEGEETSINGVKQWGDVTGSNNRVNQQGQPIGCNIEIK